MRSRLGLSVDTGNIAHKMFDITDRILESIVNIVIAWGVNIDMTHQHSIMEPEEEKIVNAIR